MCGKRNALRLMMFVAFTIMLLVPASIGQRRTRSPTRAPTRVPTTSPPTNRPTTMPPTTPTWIAHTNCDSSSYCDSAGDCFDCTACTIALDAIDGTVTELSSTFVRVCAWARVRACDIYPEFCCATQPSQVWTWELFGLLVINLHTSCLSQLDKEDWSLICNLDIADRPGQTVV